VRATCPFTSGKKMSTENTPLATAGAGIELRSLKFPNFSPGTVFPPPSVTADTLVPYAPDSKYWGMDKDYEAPPRSSKTGIAAIKQQTVSAVFMDAVKRGGDKPAFHQENVATMKGDDSEPLETHWRTISWKQYGAEARAIAAGMIEAGGDEFDAVSIWGFNCPEWVMSSMGGIQAGLKTAGIYPADSIEQVCYKCNHSDSRIFCVEDMDKLDKLKTKLEELPYLRTIVVWGGATPAETEVTRADGSVVRLLSWDQLKSLGEGKDAAVDERIARQQPGHCCTLIYTSGTTGNPKAVMISHDNIVFESSCATFHTGWSASEPEGTQERIISYLPLSHVAGMMLDIISPVFITAVQPGFCTLYFARANDLKKATIGNRLRFVKPTVFLGVPMVWQKISDKIKAAGAKNAGCKLKLVRWSKGKGLAKAKEMCLDHDKDREGQTRVVGDPCCYCLANKVVLSKVKALLGLECCKMALTGAAPIAADTIEFFAALGIQVNELYGMSECAGATTWSTDEFHVWGSCGSAMGGCEVKIFEELDGKTGKECPRATDFKKPKETEQGEICFRGRHIMMGYLANPRLGDEHVEEIKKKNEEAIDSNGWLHSGDKGTMCKFGMVRITGRFKELIIGTGGENIAPVPMEDEWKKHCPCISNIMMIGDKRKYNTAVITLKADGASGELKGSNDLLPVCDAVNPGTKTISSAMKDPAWKTYLEAGLDATNKSDACASNAWKIQKFTILPHDFSVEMGELTPTLKLKRGLAAGMWEQQIEKMYNAEGKYIDTSNL